MKLPEDFTLSMRSLLGDDSAQLFEALESEAPVTIRLNPHKLKRNPLDFNLALQPVPWSDWGFYLKERPAFTFDPLFHAGYYYVQEASSMFVEQVVRQLVKEPAICLDLCGAPGGKSVSLLSALPEGSLLVSNELVRQRANVLSETLTKYGVSTSVVTNNHPRDFNAFPELFDLVLVDAPCSGEGMFRKEVAAIEEWSKQNVAMCATRQKDILADVWPALKPGGVLVYSTCTFNRFENEENALWAAHSLGASFVEVEIEEVWGITPSIARDAICYRFFPHRLIGEGLFVTLLRKRDSSEPEIDQRAVFSSNKGRQKPSQFVKDITDFAPWVINPERFRFIEYDNRISALPVTHVETMLLLKERLKVLSMGISIGERKGKDLIPSHSLAMSIELNREAFICCELSYSEAVAFLRKEAITLSDATRGFVLLTYQHEPIGFVKNIGNRANNLYPNEWRIRSGYMPETKREILTNRSAN